MTTIEDIIKVIEKEGIARIRGALTALGYLVIKASPDPVAPDDAISVGSIAVCDITGTPIPNHRLTIEPISSNEATVIDGVSYYGSIVSSPKAVVTDEEGKAEIRLLKGTTVRVYLEGSSLVRQIKVPDIDFNLLDPNISTEPDAFSVPINAPKLIIRGDL